MMLGGIPKMLPIWVKFSHIGFLLIIVALHFDVLNCNGNNAEFYYHKLCNIIYRRFTPLSIALMSFDASD